MYRYSNSSKKRNKKKKYSEIRGSMQNIQYMSSLIKKYHRGIKVAVVFDGGDFYTFFLLLGDY